MVTTHKSLTDRRPCLFVLFQILYEISKAHCVCGFPVGVMYSHETRI